MTNRFLWFSILIVGIFYFSMPKAKKVNRSFISVFKFNDKVESKLAIIPTSPRWKYPFKNYNARLDVDGGYEFPSSTLPIVSIKVKEKHLFSYKKGIYIRGVKEWDAQSMDLSWWDWPANYKNRGKKWERKAEVDFIHFSKENRSQHGGIRINGNATRAFPQKSLRLVFKKKYQKDGIENIFFEDKKEKKYRTLLLRNGGNDWDRAMLRDVLVSRLSKNLAVETQDAKACNVYINGEYWGIHYLRPKIDDDYLVNKYAITKDDVNMIESPSIVYRGSDEGLNDFNSMINFANENDLSDSINYSIIKEQLDIESFIDYLCVNMIVVNTDWPQNNWLVWRDMDSSINNGKWRWVVKDTDYALGFFSSKAYSFDMYQKVMNDKGAIGILFKNLLVNEEFKNEFVNKFRKILKENWDVNSFNSELHSLEKSIEDEMPKQIDRWRTHLSIEDWRDEVNQVSEFYKLRRKYLLENSEMLVE